MSGVSLKNVVKSYGETQVIHGVDLTIDDGEFCVFVGPSGCGKSTVLRMIAGLETVTGGTVHIGDRDVTTMDPSNRGVAMVFQTYALYPHMTVAQNIGFGLKMTGSPKREVTEKVNRAAEILKLTDYLKRKPKALSGGQRQRVAIGRAIVRDPDVFLFDEPLSNLDAELRVDMRVELAQLHKDIGATMIYVTHDQVEAMTLADKIVVLRDGIIEQAGTPSELFTKPRNRFVGGFIGSPTMNFFDGEISDGKVTCPALPGLRLSTDASNQRVVLGVRPQQIKTSKSQDGGPITLIETLGSAAYAYVNLTNGERAVVEVPSLTDLGKSAPSVGDQVTLKTSPEAVHLFSADGEKRLN